MLYIKHRRKVAILKVDGLDKVIGLLFGWGVDAIEMVSATGKAILSSLKEILIKILVYLGRAFCGLLWP